MFRKLLERVRVDGYIGTKGEMFLNDMMPAIYRGESGPAADSVHYYNSGGRSIIFEKEGSAYRIKGVDPFGRLTKRVAKSKKNRMNDVRIVAEELASQPGTKKQLFRGRPFGVLTYNNATNEKEACERLAHEYILFGIENPAEFLCYKDTGTGRTGESVYQAAFHLPSLESDLRVNEFSGLLTERLDECSAKEIAAKSQNISRLYGRFVFWGGFNAGLFYRAGILPMADSFRPQNWVISRAGDGYGIFRVDHSSTEAADTETVYNGLMKELDGIPHIVNEFSVFPERVLVASNPDGFLPKGQRGMKFSKILHLRDKINADIGPMINAHKNVFGMGLYCAIKEQHPEPISEKMFIEALE